MLLDVQKCPTLLNSCTLLTLGGLAAAGPASLHEGHQQLPALFKCDAGAHRDSPEAERIPVSITEEDSGWIGVPPRVFIGCNRGLWSEKEGCFYRSTVLEFRARSELFNQGVAIRVDGADRIIETLLHPVFGIQDDDGPGYEGAHPWTIGAPYLFVDGLEYQCERAELKRLLFETEDESTVNLTLYKCFLPGCFPVGVEGRRMGQAEEAPECRHGRRYPRGNGIMSTATAASALSKEEAESQLS